MFAYGRPDPIVKTLQLYLLVRVIKGIHHHLRNMRRVNITLTKSSYISLKKDLIPSSFLPSWRSKNFASIMKLHKKLTYLRVWGGRWLIVHWIYRLFSYKRYSVAIEFSRSRRDWSAVWIHAYAPAPSFWLAARSASHRSDSHPCSRS